MTIKSLETKF